MRLFEPNARLCRWVEIVWPASKSKHATTFPSLVLLIHPPIQISSNHPLHHIYIYIPKLARKSTSTGRSPLSPPFFLLFYFSFLPFFSRFTLQRCSRESRSFHAQVVYINVPVANKTRTRGSKITLSSTGRNDLYWSPRRSSEQISRNGGRRLFGRTSRASTLSYFPPIFPRTMTNRIEKQSHWLHQMRFVDSISSILFC